MKDVKKANGIPDEDAEPIRIEDNKNQAEKYQTGKVLIYRVFVDVKTESRQVVFVNIVTSGDFALKLPILSNPSIRLIPLSISTIFAKRLFLMV